jgi:iron complex outermembrane receptor protein
MHLTVGLASVALVGVGDVSRADEAGLRDYVAQAEAAPEEEVAQGQGDPAPNQPQAETPKRKVAGIEEITITARKREESLTDTPISVTAFSATDLVENGVGRADDIGKFTPNLQFNQSANGQNSARLNIRGVGTNDPIATRDPGVGIYVDGVYLARAQGQLFSLVDIERIEVLRGPQGTLFGRNTVGGAVNVISKKPGDEFEADGSVRLGNFDLFESKGSINIPLVPEKAAMRLSFQSVSREGYGKNKLIGQTVDDRRSLGVRAAFRLNPTDNVEWLLTGEQTRGHAAGRSAECRPFDGNGDGKLDRADIAGPDGLLRVSTGPGPDGVAGTPDDLPPDDPAPLIAGLEMLGDLAANGTLAALGTGITPDQEFLFRPMANCLANKQDGNEFDFESQVRSKDNLDAYGLSSSITWDLDAATFKSISAWRRQDIEDNQDFSFSRVTVGNVKAKDVEFDQVSQEFNLSGTGIDNRLQWTVGAFGFYEKTRPGLVQQSVAKNTLCATVSRLVDAGVVMAGGPEITAACGATSLQRLPRLRTLALSGYGQFTYDILQNLHFTAGLRYSTESKLFSAKQQNFVSATSTIDALPNDGINPLGGGRTTSERFGKFTPLLSLSLDLAENQTSYFTYSKGFKSGGFNGRPNANVGISLAPFDQEVLNNYELGYKAAFFDRRLVTSVSAFYSLYDDIQATLLLASTRGDFASRVRMPARR